MSASRPYAAGVWDQITEESDGTGFVAWSHHATAELAQRAARKYARASKSRTGGSLSWCGGVRDASGRLRWYTSTGDDA